MKNQLITPEFLTDSERRRQLFSFAELAKDKGATGVRVSTLANLCALFRGDVRLVRTFIGRRVISQARLTTKSHVVCSFSRTVTSVASDSSFRCDGVHVQSFGHKGSAPGLGLGECWNPRGCALSVDACYLYVADTLNNRVCIFDASSCEYRHSFGSRGSEPGQFQFPTNVSVSNASQLYVCDCWNHRIQVFDAIAGTFVRTIGTGVRGSAPGQLDQPNGVVVSRKRVYVSQCDNRNVSVFAESDGAFLNSFNTHCFNTPAIAMSGSGDVYIVDGSYDYNSDYITRVQVLNEHGKCTSQHQLKQTTNQKHSSVIRRVCCVCVSETDDMYINNKTKDCAHVFDSTGTYVRSIGVCGSGNGQFHSPDGIAVSRDGRLFVVDFGHGRVCVYE